MTSETDILLRAPSCDGILRLTLNDAARRNALSEAMLTDLGAALAEAGADSVTRVIVLAANGPAFCAGHDLKELTAARAAPDSGRAFFARIMAQCAQVMQAIVNCPKPVIAEVRGVATAAGCQLVASCDLAVAAEGTRFGVNGVNIGLFCSTPMVALSRNLPRKQAFEMLTTGEFIGAARAREVGLINRIAAPEALEAETMALAGTIAAKLGAAVRIGKRVFYDQLEMPLADAYALTGAAMVENMMLEDTNEGIRAFIEKRKPAWAG